MNIGTNLKTIEIGNPYSSLGFLTSSHKALAPGKPFTHQKQYFTKFFKHFSTLDGSMYRSNAIVWYHPAGCFSIKIQLDKYSHVSQFRHSVANTNNGNIIDNMGHVKLIIT